MYQQKWAMSLRARLSSISQLKQSISNYNCSPHRCSYEESQVTTIYLPPVITIYPSHRRSYKETIYKIVNHVNLGV